MCCVGDERRDMFTTTKKKSLKERILGLMLKEVPAEMAPFIVAYIEAWKEDDLKVAVGILAKCKTPQECKTYAVLISPQFEMLKDSESYLRLLTLAQILADEDNMENKPAPRVE